MYNLELWPWPWTDLGQTRIEHPLIILDICAELFANPTRVSKDMERTRNTVIQCLTLNFDLEQTLVKHTQCTLNHYTWHLCRVICKSYQGFKRYRADLELWPWPSTDLGQTYCMSTHHIWHLGRVIWKSHQGFKRYRADMKALQTDRQTTELKIICLPHFMEVGIIYIKHWKHADWNIFFKAGFIDF